MSIGTLSEADRLKIKELIEQGVSVTRDIETLKEGLKETIDAIATELEIKHIRWQRIAMNWQKVVKYSTKSKNC